MSELDDVEAILQKQDEALALLERLRAAEPFVAAHGPLDERGRRDFRRWPKPASVRIEMHDGDRWVEVECLDLGVGGARLRGLPDWADGPTPARLAVGEATRIITLSDVMWRRTESATEGVRFEFSTPEEREAWAEGLIDALLTGYSVG